MYALYTLAGVPDDVETSTHYFETDDKLGLSALRFLRQESDDVVVLVHGLTTSTDMFIMPEHKNLVTYLLDEGFRDVWSIDYRMSNRHDYNMRRHRYNMDDIAMYDFPAAIKKIRSVVGDSKRIHVIAHCLGSVSFTMSLFAGQVTGISSLIANSVSLTPRVPRWSGIKLLMAPFMIEYVVGLPYINPRWSDDPGITPGKIVSRFNSLFHRECKVPACHMLSMMWGSGRPALYFHENLKKVTHDRGGDLYGPTSVHYFRHVRKMLRSGNRAVKFNPNDSKYSALPDDYLSNAESIETPVLFTTGAVNKVFTDSNIVTHQTLEKIVPGRHELKIFKNYGHQDVFMGMTNDEDTFPPMVEFIRKHSG